MARGAGAEREGWEGRVRGESPWGRHSHSHKENESLMTRMQEGTILSTRGTGRWGWRSWERVDFNTQIGSKNWRPGEVGGREEGEEAGATVKSQAKTPKIERHFHMYILQMYIDTIR